MDIDVQSTYEGLLDWVHIRCFQSWNPAHNHSRTVGVFSMVRYTVEDHRCIFAELWTDPQLSGDISTSIDVGETIGSAQRFPIVWIGISLYCMLLCFHLISLSHSQTR